MEADPGLKAGFKINEKSISLHSKIVVQDSEKNFQKLARTENNQYIQYSEMIAIIVILYLTGDFIFIIFFLYQVCVNEW